MNFATPGSKSFKNHIGPANLTKEDWERKLFRLFRPKGKGCDFVFAPIFFRNFVLSPFWNFGGFRSSRWHGSNRKNEIYNLRLVPRPETFKKSKKTFSLWLLRLFWFKKKCFFFFKIFCSAAIDSAKMAPVRAEKKNRLFQKT